MDNKSKLIASLRGVISHWSSYEQVDAIDVSLRLDNLAKIIIDMLELESELPDKKDEQLPLKAAPFQPECKCEAWQHRHDGKLIIRHCQYHRSIAYIYDELVAIYDPMDLAVEQRLIADLLLFIDTCKKNSFTGQIGKAGDENIGR